MDDFVRLGGKMFGIYEGFINKENFRVSPFEKIIEHLFVFKTKYEEGNHLMVDLLKLSINSFYGLPLRKDIDEEYILRSEKCFVRKR